MSLYIVLNMSGKQGNRRSNVTLYSSRYVVEIGEVMSLYIVLDMSWK